MISVLKRILKSPAAAETGAATVPPGRRVYAIGDIHGRLDLFDALLARIEADDAGREPAETTLILLGDLIDRGPDSAGVVERAMALRDSGHDVRFLMGNHEEVFLDALDGGREDVMRFFVRIGGETTLNSYGIEGAEYRDATFDELVNLARARVPEPHRAFLAGFEDAIAIGDYLFVHAGIRPGVPLAEQTSRDMRWIRGDFLGHEGPHAHIVVHGHTISEGVEQLPNRIGIDTGAFASGRLTAIGLEGARRWFLDTGA